MIVCVRVICIIVVTSCLDTHACTASVYKIIISDQAYIEWSICTPYLSIESRLVKFVQMTYVETMVI